MISKIVESLETIVGWDHINLVFGMSVRGVIIYTLATISIRLNKKFLGVRTSYNFILFITLGSLCASAITEEGLFLPITSTIVVLSIMNSIITRLFFHYPRFENFFTGKPTLLISNGEVQLNNMRAHFITKTDLINALQTQMHTTDFTKVEFAYLATDGTINFIIRS